MTIQEILDQCDDILNPPDLRDTKAYLDHGFKVLAFAPKAARVLKVAIKSLTNISDEIGLSDKERGIIRKGIADRAVTQIEFER